jgi:hypothetical protein
MLPGGSDMNDDLTLNSFSLKLGTEANSPGKTYVWDYEITSET